MDNGRKLFAFEKDNPFTKIIYVSGSQPGLIGSQPVLIGSQSDLRASQPGLTGSHGRLDYGNRSKKKLPTEFETTSRD